MPTATGKPTADEKREADRQASREARLTVTAKVADPDWYEATADEFVRRWLKHREGQAHGTIPSYESYGMNWEAGEKHEVKVGRRTFRVDEGKARAYGVADVLRARGIQTHNIMTIGLGEGRQGVLYHVEYR